MCVHVCMVVRLCLCSAVQQILGITVPETADENTERHTFGIDIRMIHLSAKDIFSVWDFAGQVLYTFTCSLYCPVHVNVHTFVHPYTCTYM